MPSKSKKSSKVNSKAVMEEIKNLALVGAGVVAGSVGGRMVDKVLKVDPAQQGFNAKAMVRPALLIGVGAFGAMKAKNHMMRMLAAGVGASGALSGIKALTKKDLLSGPDGGGLGSSWPTSVYREPLNMSVERYNPDLPMLSAGPLSDAYGEAVPMADELEAVEII